MNPAWTCRLTATASTPSTRATPASEENDNQNMEIVLDQSGFRQVGHIVPILFALGGDGIGGKRWRSLLEKLKHSLASLEKLRAIFPLKIPNDQETRRGQRQETIIWMRPHFYSSTFVTAFTGCSRWDREDFSKCTTSSIISITPNTNTTNQGLPDLLLYDPGLGRLRHLDLV